MLLENFPHQIGGGGGENVHIGTGADIRSTKTQSENHCMHFNSVLRTPTKFVLFSNQKLENIFIFKISRQQRP